MINYHQVCKFASATPACQMIATGFRVANVSLTMGHWTSGHCSTVQFCQWQCQTVSDCASETAQTRRDACKLKLMLVQNLSSYSNIAWASCQWCTSRCPDVAHQLVPHSSIASLPSYPVGLCWLSARQPCEHTARQPCKRTMREHTSASIPSPSPGARAHSQGISAIQWSPSPVARDRVRGWLSSLGRSSPVSGDGQWMARGWRSSGPGDGSPESVLTQTGRAHPMGSDQKQSDGPDISTQACKLPSISMQIRSRHCIA